MATPTNVTYRRASSGTVAGGRKVFEGHAGAILQAQASLAVLNGLAAGAQAFASGSGQLGVVRNFAASAAALALAHGALAIEFAWDANPAGEAVTSYKLYYGSASGVYDGAGSPINVGNVTSFALAHPGVQRYYAITAVNASGESAFSANELLR